MRQALTNFVYYYLRFWARIALARHKPEVIGITGSVGKSSARNAIYAIFKDYFPTIAIRKGNSETGIPLGILGLAPDTYSPFDWLRMLLSAPFRLNYLRGIRYLVIEMAIDDPYLPKNMAYLLTIIKPHTSVFLNVHAVHTEQFDKTVSDIITDPAERLEKIKANIAFEKGRIITDSGCYTAIYNADNKYVTDALRDKITASQVFTFGASKKNTISYADYEATAAHTSFTFLINKEKLTLLFPGYLMPEEYREVFAAALLAGMSVGLTADQMRSALTKNFFLPPGRSSLLKGIKESVIIDSTYNASKAAVLAFLNLAAKLKKDTHRPVVFIFGDMRELGREAGPEHEEVAKKINETVDYLYCIGPLTKLYIIPTVKKPKEVQWFETSTKAGEYIKDHLPEKSIILAKGSQNTLFTEEALKPLLADKNDISKLCRQTDFWMRKKRL